MSIASHTDWEIRDTGAETNGGGFKDLNPGTSVDYSQQATAQLALTDIASNAAGTGISSATGGFTAAMEGNCMYISGTGFVTGWYQIVGYTDTNNITIDRSCGASASGGTGNVGGAYKIGAGGTFATFFNTTNKASYDVCHVRAGNYSINGAGVITLARTYLRWRGYQTTRGDAPTGTNRPLINGGDSNACINWTGVYGVLEHLRFNNDYTSAGSNTMYISGGGSVLRNCKFTRTGYNANALSVGAIWAKIYQCEFESTLGIGLLISNSGIRVDYCWAHDCGSKGIANSGSSSYGVVVSNSIISNCASVGIQLYYGSAVQNCTVYNCLTGIQFATNLYMVAYSNIVQGCTIGITADEVTYSDFNIVYNCTTAYSGGVVPGPNSLTSDPLLVDPVNDDFTLSSASPAFNAGMKLGAIVGLP